VTVGAVWALVSYLREVRPDESLIAVALGERWAKLLELRGEVTKAMEEARKAGLVKQPNEALVTIEGPADVLALARETEELRALLLAGDVALRPGATTRARIERAPGGKCERCWNVRELGARADHPTLCARCAGVVA
jgi:isoleucyl-tRNA synthetase